VFQCLFRVDYDGGSGDDERGELFLTFRDAEAYASEVANDRGHNSPKTAVIRLVDDDKG
jgi:hypothetical protein